MKKRQDTKAEDTYLAKSRTFPFLSPTVGGHDGKSEQLVLKVALPRTSRSCTRRLREPEVLQAYSRQLAGHVCFGLKVLAEPR